MPRKTLTELAQNPDLIPGIYNYCDRWCERCPLTSRCLVYATEDQFSENNQIENNDIRNAEFWHSISDTLTQVRALIPLWANDAPNLKNAAEQKTVRRQSRTVDNHPLTKAAKHYANTASDWFRELEHNSEPTLTSAKPPTEVDRHNPQPFEDARGVIEWYQYQIAVKTIRALSGQKEELEEAEELKNEGLSPLSKGLDVPGSELDDENEKHTTNTTNPQINLSNALFFIIFERC